MAPQQRYSRVPGVPEAGILPAKPKKQRYFVVLVVTLVASLLALLVLLYRTRHVTWIDWDNDSDEYYDDDDEDDAYADSHAPHRIRFSTKELLDPTAKFYVPDPVPVCLTDGGDRQTVPREAYFHSSQASIDERQAVKDKFLQATQFVRNYVFFLGYPHTGHTLVGALLDTHPQVLITDEAHAFGILASNTYPVGSDEQARASKNKLYLKLAEWALHTNRKGWMQQGYSYRVPRTAQGRWGKNIIAIGDKKGGSTSSFLQRCAMSDAGNKGVAKFFTYLERVVGGVRLKVYHVVRSPFDLIAHDLDRSVVTYKLNDFQVKDYDACSKPSRRLNFMQIKELFDFKVKTPFLRNLNVSTIIEANDFGDVMDINIEAFTKRPAEQLGRAFEHLEGLTKAFDRAKLTKITRKVASSPHEHWRHFCWDRKAVHYVEKFMSEFEAFRPYVNSIDERHLFDE